MEHLKPFFKNVFQSVELITSYREGALMIWRNRPIFLIGLVQSIVESCMYIFVFLWTPVLSTALAPAPLGMIFSCFMVTFLNGPSLAVWPDWAIFWTLGKFLKPLATINLPKSPTFLDNFCKGVQIYHFSSEIIFGQLFRHLAIFSGHTDPWPLFHFIFGL